MSDHEIDFIPYDKEKEALKHGVKAENAEFKIGMKRSRSAALQQPEISPYQASPVATFSKALPQGQVYEQPKPTAFYQEALDKDQEEVQRMMEPSKRMKVSTESPEEEVSKPQMKDMGDTTEAQAMDEKKDKVEDANMETS